MKTLPRACGISINLYKSKCFLVAAFTAGIAGSLYAHQARYLNPNDFTFNKSIEILIMVVVGGLGSMPGAVIGALVVVLMPEYLRSSGELRLILFGALVVVLMGFSRGGIAGLRPRARADASCALRGRRKSPAPGDALQ